MSPEQQRISVSPDTLINRVGEESVLLDLKSEHYFGLNETGTRMWAALMEAGTVAGAHAALLAQYDVDPERLRADLDDLVAKLVERGLARIDA